MGLKRTMRYPVVLHTDDNIRYGVTVPDLPGCFSAGDSLDDALASAVEAIELHLEGMTETGQDLPLPSPVAELNKQPDFAGGIWALVDVDTTRFEGKAEKVNITLPRRLLHKIDEAARARHLSRSAFLALAAKREMQGDGT